MKGRKRITSLILSISLFAAWGCDQNQQKIQDLEKEKADLSSQLAKAKDEVAAAEEKSAHDIADLTKQLEAAKAQSKSRASELEKANGRATDAERALADLSTKHEKSLAEAASLRARLEQANKRATGAEQSLAELRTAHEQALADAKGAAEKAAAEMEALKKQVAELSKALREAKSDVPGGSSAPSP